MRLIADSGSTKTAWCLSDGVGNDRLVMTQGINPFHQNEEEICALLRHELLYAIGDVSKVDSVFFYGAGCTPEKSTVVRSALRSTFGSGIRAEVESDLLGAARALFGSGSGVACILGTGSNSCFYDGKFIVDNVSPLGYILGDEGSGAYIGRRLVGDCLKRQFPEDVCNLFYDETHLTAATVVQKVYREPMPNRFLASLSPFCARHRDIPCIRDFLIDCFREFLKRNVMGYDVYVLRGKMTVSFVGSIAYYYEKELVEAARSLGLAVGKVVQTPLEGLLDYHNALDAAN